MYNWIFADGYAKALKPQATCMCRMWIDQFIDYVNGCADVDKVAAEFK